MKLPKKKISKKEPKEPTGKLYNAVTYAIHAVVMVILLYTGIIYTAVNVIPMMCARVLQAMGITQETGLLDVFALWILPCLFIAIALIVIECVVFYFINKGLNKSFGKLRKKHLKGLMDEYENKKKEQV